MTWTGLGEKCTLARTHTQMITQKRTLYRHTHIHIAHTPSHTDFFHRSVAAVERNLHETYTQPHMHTHKYLHITYFHCISLKQLMKELMYVEVRRKETDHKDRKT